MRKGLCSSVRKACAEKLLDSFGVSVSQNPSCPSASVETEIKEENIYGPYTYLVGGLMWKATTTRPDIGNAVR